jgi:DNA-binding MarR family transcriptional regulator
LSHVVARLERDGWVRREPAGDDARGSVAVLTEAGWDKVVATAPGHVAAVRAAVFDRLSPAQVRQLERVGGAVLAGLDEDRRAGPG